MAEEHRGRSSQEIGSTTTKKESTQHLHHSEVRQDKQSPRARRQIYPPRKLHLTINSRSRTRAETARGITKKRDLPASELVANKDTDRHTTPTAEHELEQQQSSIPWLPGREHPVGFVGPLGDEIVHQDPDVAFVTPDRELGLSNRFQPSVRPCVQCRRTREAATLGKKSSREHCATQVLPSRVKSFLERQSLARKLMHAHMAFMIQPCI